MFFTILIVFISLIGLITLHELGHFVLAKRFGVKVEEFGLGLPPRIFGKKIGETLYSLNLLPLGAFVKLYGEEDQEKKEYWSFTQKPIWQRVLIVIGGVVNFWLISAILLSIVMGLGMPTTILDEDEVNGNLINPKVQVFGIAPNSPAEIAGIKPGDTIKEFKIHNSKFKIQKVSNLQSLTEKYKGQEVVLTIERGKDIFDVSLIPRVEPPATEGPMGVVLGRTALKSYPWYQAPFKGVEATFKLTGSIIINWVKLLGNLIFGKGLPPGTQLMGPVGIGALMIQFAQLGMNYYLYLIAIISIYIALFNILPIPALDGGKLVFLGIEAIRKRAVSSRTEQKISAFFFALLIGLIIWVTIKDISRIF